jgi:hypothetical protein
LHRFSSLISNTVRAETIAFARVANSWRAWTVGDDARHGHAEAPDVNHPGVIRIGEDEAAGKEAARTVALALPFTPGGALRR